MEKLIFSGQLTIYKDIEPRDFDALESELNCGFPYPLGEYTFRAGWTSDHHYVYESRQGDGTYIALCSPDEGIITSLLGASRALSPDRPGDFKSLMTLAEAKLTPLFRWLGLEASK